MHLGSGIIPPYRLRVGRQFAKRTPSYQAGTPLYGRKDLRMTTLSVQWELWAHGDFQANGAWYGATQIYSSKTSIHYSIYGGGKSYANKTTRYLWKVFCRCLRHSSSIGRKQSRRCNHTIIHSCNTIVLDSNCRLHETKALWAIGFRSRFSQCVNYMRFNEK